MATRTIGTELKLTGEKEFNQQMKAINNSLKTTKSEMSVLSSEFDDNANSMKALTAKQKLQNTAANKILFVIIKDCVIDSQQIYEKICEYAGL